MALAAAEELVREADIPTQTTHCCVKIPHYSDIHFFDFGDADPQIHALDFIFCKMKERERKRER